MKINTDSIEELKEWEYDLTEGQQAYKYDAVSKKIGECVGRVYSKEMKILVVSGKEATLVKPTYPSGDAATEAEKAIWSKEYDSYMKKKDKYDNDKASTYEVVWKQCTKEMKNRIEKLGNYESIEADNNVIDLLGAIKVQVFDANEKKNPSLRMVLAWKKLSSCRQYENEDLIDYYRRFVGMIEMVELSHGNIKPNDNEDKERSKFIAMMFLEGVDKKQYGYLLKDLETDCSLGKKEVYPESIEDALQVLIMYSEKALKKKKKELNKDPVAASFVQVRKCWECGSEDHVKKECPQWNARQSKTPKKPAVSAVQLCRGKEPTTPVWIG